MKILEFVPVKDLPEQPSLGPILIDNSRGDTLAKKIAVLKEYDADYYIFPARRPQDRNTGAY